MKTLSKTVLCDNLFYALKVLKVQVVYFTDVFCSLLLISRKSSVNQKQRLKLFNRNDLIKYKKSDTLFILGSGFSLNTITDDQWRIIQAGDVLTFNHSYMVDIRANYYICELADESTMSKITSDLCSIRAYDNVPKLFKPETPNILQAIRRYNQFTLSNSIFTPQVWLPTSNYKLFKKQFWRLSQYSCFLPVSFPSMQTIFRASLDQAIGLGLQLNYQHIVLLGIDLNTKYFFEDPKLLRKNLKALHNYNKKTPGIHPTIRDPDTRLTIIDVVKELIKFCAKKKSSTLFYRGLNPELSDLLPDYYWH